MNKRSGTRKRFKEHIMEQIKHLLDSSAGTCNQVLE